ncbi:MAG: glycoside hydrolase family 3 N-terminal domain-containing protein, partial [Firmicutes bacterium]|nr:glycoside hydrolase family 3 N-terminal domain-containing protein [Bacillota bacterium]
MAVNLRANPFFLDDTQIDWVNRTRDGMTLREKVGQLICCVSPGDSCEELLARYREIPYGGITFRVAPAKQIKERVDFIQSQVKIPLLVSANLETGGCGVASDGTDFASQLEVAATDDPTYAEALGEVCGVEGSAIGVNYTFAPVVDIHYNWRNAIINTRTYGSDPNRVLDFSRAYLRGISAHNMAVSIKHFPGDGVDERDQHLLSSVNSLSCEKWDASYGRVYQTLIDEGAQTVMVGHILLP